MTSKPNNYPEGVAVNVAGIWDEGYAHYPGSLHGALQRSAVCRARSAGSWLRLASLARVASGVVMGRSAGVVRLAGCQCYALGMALTLQELSSTRLETRTKESWNYASVLALRSQQREAKAKFPRVIRPLSSCKGSVATHPNPDLRMRRLSSQGGSCSVRRERIAGLA